jgi:hypothetical protein
MTKPVALITIIVLLFSPGCIVPVLTTPTRHEKKIPAEYNLAVIEDRTIVVLVENPIWANAPVGLTSQLTAELNSNLTDKIGLKSEVLIPYERLQTFRATAPDVAGLSPSGLGKAVGADLVLFVEVHDFALSKTIETDYYKGLLEGRAALFDAGSGQRLWPESEHGKLIRVAFDVEQGDYDEAVSRLSRAFAHCVTRYLYDCPVAKFKIFEDKSGTGWRDWQD